MLKPNASNQIVDELQVHGFSRCTLGNEPSRRLHELIAAAFEFFRSSEELKRLSVFPNECGYRAFGSEYSDTPDRPDQMESYTVSGRMLDSWSSISETDRLVDAAFQVFVDFESIAIEIGRRLAESLGCSPTLAVPDRAGRRWSRLQLNYSKPSRILSGLIHEAHEDGCFATVGGATGPGLEILLPNGRTTAGSTETDEVVVMAGGIAAAMTGGIVRAAYHRVVPMPNLPERLAYLFFLDLEPDVCTPWVDSALNRQIDIGSQVRSNVQRFGLTGFDAD